MKPTLSFTVRTKEEYSGSLGLFVYRAFRELDPRNNPISVAELPGPEVKLTAYSDKMAEELFNFLWNHSKDNWLIIE